MPLEVTTRSIGIRPVTKIRSATMLVIIQTMPRAERGTGAFTIAVDGHWNSSMTGSVGSCFTDRRRLGTKIVARALLTIGQFLAAGKFMMVSFHCGHRGTPPERQSWGDDLGSQESGFAATRGDDRSRSVREARYAGQNRRPCPA